MRKLFTILFICFPILSNADYWTQKANIPGAGRIFAIGMSIGNKGYIGTGFEAFGDTSAFWEFDPAVNSWNQKSDFLGNMREAAVCFSINTKGYICTGAEFTNAIAYKDLWEFNSVTNTWSQKADFAGTERSSAIGFSIGGKGYVGTGYDMSSNEYADFWEYDPLLNTWLQKADFGGLELTIGTSFSNGIKGYVGTGTNNSIWPYGRNDFWEYDPNTDTWTQLANFGGIPRSEACSFGLCNFGYIGTGTSRIGNFGEAKSDFWKYEYATNTWTQAANFVGGVREGAVGFSIGNKGYVGTGWANNNSTTMTNDFWEYTPDVCTTSMEEYSEENSRLIISPNPTKDYIVINSVYLLKPTVIKITDNKGRKVFTTTITNKRGSITISITNYKTGIYFIELTEGKQRAVGKFVKI